jgi:GNAT superfamily N-acetyltransferase
LSTSWQSRPIQEVEVHRILDLLRRSLGDSATTRTEAFWQWKHLENPFGRSLGLAATAGEELVALRPLMRWKWRAGSTTWSAARAVDTATHPQWRRRGVFRDLTERALASAADEVAVIFNTPNAASRAGYLQMGWRVAGRVPLWILPVRPFRMIAAWAGRGGARREERLPTTGRSMAELLGRPELEPLLLAQEDSSGRCETPKTVSYLRWRYGDSSGLGYRALWSFAPGSAGALVFRERMRGRLRELDLSEVLVGAGQGSLHAVGGLIRELARQSQADCLAAVASPGTPERGALARAGFLPLAPVAPRLCIRSLDPQFPGASIDDWRLCLGDIEVF